MKTAIGFRELDHTADWQLEVWAPDLPALLEEAARGMYALSGVCIEDTPRKNRTLILDAPDAESLMVKFLSNLLWYEESQQLGFDTFNLKISKGIDISLRAEMSGAAISGLDKEIKAVTYHNLEIQTTPQGLRVVIVFDV